MGDRTNIAWCDSTWNPTRGCSIVSPGCTNCYAMKTAHRFAGPGKPYEGLTQVVNGSPVWNGKIRLVPEQLDQPLRWRKPRRIFVNSMSDLFHEDVPFPYVDKVFAAMALAPRHTFQILTKRPERMRSYFEDLQNRAYEIGTSIGDFFGDPKRREIGEPAINRAHGFSPEDTDFEGEQGEQTLLPLPNVHLGVSVEDQPRLLERWPHLSQTPAAVRFLSCEPLLSELDFMEAGSLGAESGDPCAPFSALEGYDGSDPPIPGVDWVIVGGESGPKARPCQFVWLESIVQQCQKASVPVFVKQTGRRIYYDEGRGWVNLKHSKGGDPSEWPESIRVRQFPEVQP